VIALAGTGDRHRPEWPIGLAGIRTNLVLCIDEERNVGPSDLPAAARVVRYRRRIDPAAVLRAIRGE
jgi:hypothetical protein